MPERPYFAGGQHTPSGICDSHCGACYRPAGVGILTLGGVVLCGTCHSLYARDVELYKHERMGKLRSDALALVHLGLKGVR